MKLGAVQGWAPGHWVISKQLFQAKLVEGLF